MPPPTCSTAYSTPAEYIGPGPWLSLAAVAGAVDPGDGFSPLEAREREPCRGPRPDARPAASLPHSPGRILISLCSAVRGAHGQAGSRVCPRGNQAQDTEYSVLLLPSLHRTANLKVHATAPRHSLASHQEQEKYHFPLRECLITRLHPLSLQITTPFIPVQSTVSMHTARYGTLVCLCLYYAVQSTIPEPGEPRQVPREISTCTPSLSLLSSSKRPCSASSPTGGHGPALCRRTG